MVEYSKVNVKLTDTQLKKLKTAVKNKTGTTRWGICNVGTHWIALFCNRNEIVYFDSFGVEHVPEEIKEFLGDKNIKANTFRVQANNSVMCGYFWTVVIDFMLACKKLTDYSNLLSPHDFKKNDKIILSYFKNE